MLLQVVICLQCITVIVNYSFVCRKARRKEREGGESASSSDSKLYLESTVLERKLHETDMRILVDLPAGLDYNEWLASHSKYFVCG